MYVYSESDLVDVCGREEPELQLHAVDHGHCLRSGVMIPGMARVSPHHRALTSVTI